MNFLDPTELFCYTINLAAVTSRKSSDAASVQVKNKKKKDITTGFIYVMPDLSSKQASVNFSYETSTQMITTYIG